MNYILKFDSFDDLRRQMIEYHKSQEVLAARRELTETTQKGKALRRGEVIAHSDTIFLWEHMELIQVAPCDEAA